VPLGDVTEKNAVLDSMFGVSASSAMAASHEVALFAGVPPDGGVEITGPGYARVTIPNDATWPAAADAMKTVIATFPAPTGAWDEATCWVLFNGTAITAWEQFTAPLDISGAGAGPAVSVTVYIPDETNVGL
jgi:hypothetical protein